MATDYLLLITYKLYDFILPQSEFIRLYLRSIQIEKRTRLDRILPQKSQIYLSK